MKTNVIFVLILTSLALGCGSYSSNTPTAQPGTMPAISQLVPNSAISGGSNFTLTINGSNFATSAVVNWNGTAQTTTYVSATQVTAAIPASAIASPATIQVTVTNPAVAGTGGQYGTGGTLAETSASTNFTVN